MFWSHFLSFYFEQTLDLVIRVSFEWNLFFNSEFRKPYWSECLDHSILIFVFFFSLKLSLDLTSSSYELEKITCVYLEGTWIAYFLPIAIVS